MRINNDALVKIQYRLYCGTGVNDQDLVEETSEDEPLEFIFGAGLMLPAFEANLVGKSEGDEFDFILEPDEAYGARQEELMITLDKEVFLVDGAFDEEMIEVDAMIPMLTADGQQVVGRVVRINDQSVDMDFNHDLAGETLHFIGHVQEVSVPSDEDYQRLMPHQSGCCGCHSDEQSSGCGSGCSCDPHQQH